MSYIFFDKIPLRSVPRLCTYGAQFHACFAESVFPRTRRRKTIERYFAPSGAKLLRGLFCQAGAASSWRNRSGLPICICMLIPAQVPETPSAVGQGTQFLQHLRQLLIHGLGAELACTYLFVTTAAVFQH